MEKRRVIVIGAGIVGLATARALALKGYDVDVFEKSPKAQGASVRNFGMVWPVGQPSGKLHERAMQSRGIWKEIADQANIWHGEVGSLHMAYTPQELSVIEEFAAKNQKYNILSSKQTIDKSEAVVEEGLLGALWSGDELIVDPREAMAKIPGLLTKQYGVVFHWNTAIVEVNYPKVRAGNTWYEADQIIVCSGADFETLFPEEFKAVGITKCKLQMMRLVSQPQQWKIGPALCGGLTLAHYGSFKEMDSHLYLQQYFEKKYPEYLKLGLNVMVSQNGLGELTVGDSHEYGLDLDPFNRKYIDDIILKYLSSFAQFKDWTIDSYWNGVYPKMQNGSTEIVITPEEGVTIVNGLGGAGMTLSFGLAEEVVATI